METESEEDADYIPILRDFRYESFEDTSETSGEESDDENSLSEFDEEEISGGIDGVQTHHFDLNIAVFLILPGLPDNLLLTVTILYLALMKGMIQRRGNYITQ